MNFIQLKRDTHTTYICLNIYVAHESKWDARNNGKNTSHTHTHTRILRFEKEEYKCVHKLKCALIDHFIKCALLNSNKMNPVSGKDESKTKRNEDKDVENQVLVCINGVCCTQCIKSGSICIWLKKDSSISSRCKSHSEQGNNIKIDWRKNSTFEMFFPFNFSV